MRRYVHALASEVNYKIKEVQKGAKTQSFQAVAVLAALQLADELERELIRRRSCASGCAESRATALVDRELKK